MVDFSQTENTASTMLRTASTTRIQAITDRQRLPALDCRRLGKLSLQSGVLGADCLDFLGRHRSDRGHRIGLIVGHSTPPLAQGSGRNGAKVGLHSAREPVIHQAMWVRMLHTPEQEDKKL